MISDLEWKSLTSAELLSLQPVPVGMTKVATAADLHNKIAEVPSCHSAVFTPQQLKSLREQLQPDLGQVALEVAAKIIATLNLIPGLQDSPYVRIPNLFIGGLDVILALDKAEWKDAPTIILKVLNQADALASAVGISLPPTFSFIATVGVAAKSAGDAAMSIRGQFTDKNDLAGVFTVAQLAQTFSTISKIRENLDAMRA